MKIKDLDDLKVFAFKAAVAFSKIDPSSDTCKEIAAELGMKLDALKQHSSGIYDSKTPLSLTDADRLHLANFIGRLREKIIGVTTSESSEQRNLGIAKSDFNVDAKEALDNLFAIFQLGCCYKANAPLMFSFVHVPTFIEIMNALDPKLNATENKGLSSVELKELKNFLKLQKIDKSPYTMDQEEVKKAAKKARLKLHPDKGGKEEEFKKFDGLYKIWIANKPEDIQDIELKKTGLEIQQLFCEIYNKSVCKICKSSAEYHDTSYSPTL
ncbi:MAG: hypothetical protein LW825_00285 [Candidatus Jidaibacter sp.]|nr:hypothetical protein [Candidatus Jidaibacter sp.]